MRKSEIYFKAQAAVIDSSMHRVDKLAVLRELMAQEDFAKLIESKEDEELLKAGEEA